uniref:Uncharacterized protein n=1 Tax=Rhizobium leguminosarum TaxID=384 RepID=A0A179BQU0_RHILE|nr:hypothetical protein A4U53_23880 [Rhizobium leguminosarum]
MRRNLVKGNRRRANGKGGSNDDQADGLVEDHGFQSGKAERADQEGKTEFRATESDQTTKSSDGHPADERS